MVSKINEEENVDDLEITEPNSPLFKPNLGKAELHILHIKQTLEHGLYLIIFVFEGDFSGPGKIIWSKKTLAVP